MNNIYDTHAEQSILGAILLDKNVIHEVESLPSDVFYNEAHKVIFNRMLELKYQRIIKGQYMI
ncbi:MULTISPECIES: DnaB-like helicase N-terminal domain-containing protein [Terrisporobacter]|uniref:DnaB-like helicase N-terminal domain-containing protein n=1 Tax=Terrisporobacter TaxID=1505652 RepID=UPI0009430AC6